MEAVGKPGPSMSLSISNFYVGEGSDFSGVPTKMLPVNESLRMSIYNLATIFGIHVVINLIYSDIAVATAQSLSISNFYVGEGSDFSGVPTKMLPVDESLRMRIYNPATIFGIHVAINLIYSEIAVAIGQLKKYYQYQPRKSRWTLSVIVKGDMVPLYGAGSSLATSQNGMQIP